jgi:hypothetical protein
MSYKKWVYKYKYLKFEFEEAEDLQKGYISDFNSLFKFKKPKELPEPIIPKEDIPPKKVRQKKDKNLKDLYKKLSKKLHPDKGGTEEEFNKLNQLYEENNILEMAIKAEELNLKIKHLENLFSEENFITLCKNVEDKTEFFKSTLAWKWANADEEYKKVLLPLFEEQHGVVLKENV